MTKIFTSIALCAALFMSASLSAQAPVFTDAYTAGVAFVAFDGSVNAVTIDNTVNQSGTSSIKIAVPAAGYTGGAFVAATPQNLSTYNAVSFWIKGSAAKTLNVAGLGNSTAATVYATELEKIAVTTTWTKVIIPIPVPAKFTAETGLFHFAEGGDEGAYTIWLDNIQYENLAATVVGTPTAAIATETITKGINDAFEASGLTCSFPINGVATVLKPAKAYFTFTSSTPAVATVDALGVGKALSVGTSTITAKLGAVTAAGTLTVNVSAVTAPTTAAPTPTRLAANVISLFSKQPYTNVAGTDWFPNWGQSTVVSDVIIAGDTTKKYTNFNYQGVQFANPINVTTMTHLHVDIWTPNITSFKVFLINTPPLTQAEQAVTLTPTLSGWNSFDIPLASYTTIVKTGIGQLKLESVPFGGATAYLDNIYFYKEAVVATAPTVAAPTPTRLAANVISLFSKQPYTNVAGTDWFPNWGQSTVVSDVIIAGDTTKKYTNFNYQGVAFANPINVTTMGFLHIDLWTPDMTSFKVSLINIAPLTQAEQAVTLTPTLAGWNSFDIPLASYTNIVKTGIGQLKLEGVPSGTSTAYLDNIYFYKEPINAPLVAAPTPTRPAANVISLFSKQPYTNVAGTDWFPNWGQSTVVSDVIIAGDTTKKYTNFNYQGVQFANPINVTTMNYFHIDVWTPDMTSLKVFLINIPPLTQAEQAVTLTPTLAGWNSFDIPLSSYTTIVKTGIGQLKLEGVPSGATAYLDNLYFFKTGVGTKDVTFAKNLFSVTPSVSEASVTLNLTENVKGATQITLSNLSGQTIYNQTIAANGTGLSHAISTKNLPAGMYVVGVRVGSTIQNEKIVIAH